MVVKNSWRVGCGSEKSEGVPTFFHLDTPEGVWQSKTDEEWGVAVKNHKKLELSHHLREGPRSDLQGA